MKPYIRDLLLLLLVILCLQIGCHWQRNVDNSATVETVYIKGKDSIRVDTVKVNVIVYKPTPVITYAVDTIVDSTLCDSIREYELNNDTIKIASTVQGKLIKQDVLYKMFNTSTFRVDTLRITKTETKYKPVLMPFVEVQNSPYPLSVGVILGRNRTFIGAKVNQQGNFSGIFGYNLVK